MPDTGSAEAWPLTAPCRPSPAPSAEATSRGHVLVRGDAGERHEMHHPLLGPAADGVREPGLAEAAGADDGDGAGGAQQPLHRRDVLVPAEQRVRLVRHAVPDHGRLAAQQLLLYGLEPGARIRAELVAQLAAVGLVPRQRGGRARRRRLAAQQLGEHLLVARMLRRRPRPAARPPPRAAPAGRARAPARVRACRGRGRARRAARPRGRRLSPAPSGVPSHSASPASAAASDPAWSPALARSALAAACSSRAELSTWSSARASRYPVGVLDDDVGAQLRPRPGHEDLHRLSRPLRQLVRPQPVHQPLGAAARAQVAREQREQAAEPGRGDLLSAIGDTRQQGQVGGHPCRLAKAPAAGTPAAGRTPAARAALPCGRARSKSRSPPKTRSPDSTRLGTAHRHGDQGLSGGSERRKAADPINADGRARPASPAPQMGVPAPRLRHRRWACPPRVSGTADGRARPASPARSAGPASGRRLGAVGGQEAVAEGVHPPDRGLRAGLQAVLPAPAGDPVQHGRVVGDDRDRHVPAGVARR